MEIVKLKTMDAWKEALKTVMKKGRAYEDSDRRICRELLNLMICVKKPMKDNDGPIQRLNEFEMWTYPSLKEIRDIVFLRRLAAEYDYSYGPRIFNFQNFKDQVRKYIVPLLKKDSHSRRAVVSLWDPKVDSRVYSKNVPGLVTLDFKLRNGKLNLTAIIRSNDLFFGWPANFYQLYVLTEFIAKKLEVQVGSISTFSTSAHIFDDQIKHIENVLEN